MEVTWKCSNWCRSRISKMIIKMIQVKFKRKVTGKRDISESIPILPGQYILQMQIHEWGWGVGVTPFSLTKIGEKKGTHLQWAHCQFTTPLFPNPLRDQYPTSRLRAALCLKGILRHKHALVSWHEGSPGRRLKALSIKACYLLNAKATDWQQVLPVYFDMYCAM